MKGLKMKQWFFSKKGAVTLLIIAWLIEIWRSFLDAMFVLPVDFGEEFLLQLAAIIFVVLFSLWAWTIFLTHINNKKGMIAAFLLNALILFAIPVSWLFIYCPAECRATAGIFNLANTLNLIFGVLAGFSLASQIFSKNHHPETNMMVNA
jgi:hypothetical protein